jgi:hypothetical protein
MSSEYTLHEKLLSGTSITMLPLIFLGEVILAIYMLITGNYKSFAEFIIIGIVLIWF